MTVSQKLGEKMYADQQGQGCCRCSRRRNCRQPLATQPVAAAHADDDVVDAEVKEVKKG
jgi:molecular chaperone DnaK